MTQKRKPDIVLGDYWKDNEHFADLYNAVLFGGKQVLLPDDLEERDSDVSCVLEHRELVKNIKAARDVITIVIYYGEKAWDGAKTLKEMLTIPQELDEYVNDYRMHLVEIKDNNLKLNNQHNRDLFQICGILYDHEQSLTERKKRVLDYTEQNKVDSNVLKAVGATVGKEIKVKSKDGEKMCTFFDELERECEMRGRREGEIIGEERGRSEGSFQKAVQVVKNVMGKLGMSLEEACELAEISTENYQKYANRVC